MFLALCNMFSEVFSTELRRLVVQQDSNVLRAMRVFRHNATFRRVLKNHGKKVYISYVGNRSNRFIKFSLRAKTFRVLRVTSSIVLAPVDLMRVIHNCKKPL